MKPMTPTAIASIPAPIVWNEEGRPFGVRSVHKGESYGRDDCLMHDKDDPLIEFYDRSQDPKKFGERGQFVSRYYLSTLRADCDKNHLRSGLDLCGHEPAWKLDSTAMTQIHRWLDMVFPR